MRTIIAFVMFMFLPLSANAIQVFVNDGEQFNPENQNTYHLVGALSDSNRELTYGVNLDVGETFNFIVTAPSEFDLIAIMSTGPNGSGNAIINPNGEYAIYAGTTKIFPASWQYFAGYTNWLTIGVDDAAVAIINDVYGGSLPIAAVPEPAAWLSMLSGLALIGFMAKRRSKQIAV
jgi:hypothetical protein